MYVCMYVCVYIYIYIYIYISPLLSANQTRTVHYHGISTIINLKLVSIVIISISSSIADPNSYSRPGTTPLYYN